MEVLFLHQAAFASSVEAYRAIIASLPYHLLVELLNIESNYENSPADIRAQLNKELIPIIAQGMVY